MEADPLATEQQPAREDIVAGELLMVVIIGAVLGRGVSITEYREIVSGDREHRWMGSEQLEDIV